MGTLTIEQMKEFSIICAVSLNGIIGDSATNSIPWHLPSDLKHFKELTVGKTIVMGAKTYNSLGRKLPNRKHVVISRGNTALFAPPEDIHTTVSEALRSEPDCFVIGGEHIFGEALRHLPKKLYITLVKHHAVGDVRFPIEGRRFVQDAVHLSDATVYNCINRSSPQHENNIDFQFTTFQRR
jgi:dihydrofolate reductase